LRQDAARVFQSATKSAISRAEWVATELPVDFGAVEVKADIEVCVKNVEDKLDAF
jgi:hypothetical protein